MASLLAAAKVGFSTELERQGPGMSKKLISPQIERNVYF